MAMQSAADWQFSAAIVGSAGSGKTCLLRALLGESFSEKIGYRQTFGAELGAVQGAVNGETVEVRMTSLSGSYNLLPVTQLHLQDRPMAVIVVYAANSVSSFKETLFWVNEAVRLSPGCMIVLVGTHADAASKVNGADALMQAKEWGGRAFRVSSKTGRGVDEFKKALP